MGGQLFETMPEDVRQAFSDAVRLYNHWRVERPNVPAPTLGFRALRVSLSGICDLIAAYKKERLPQAVHDELWTLTRRCAGPVTVVPKARRR